MEQTKQAYRERGTMPLLESVWQDLRFTFRQLSKNPAFAVTAIVVLALGLGASVAIFAFVDAALIKPLPYRDPARIVGVYETAAKIPRSNLSYLDYQDWKKLQPGFQLTGRLDVQRLRLNTPTGLQLAPGARVSDGFFRTLGVNPLLGRDFYSGEDQPRAAHSVILSYNGWQKWFGGTQRMCLASRSLLSGVSYTIVGVLPPDVSFCAARSPGLLGDAASRLVLAKRGEAVTTCTAWRG